MNIIGHAYDMTLLDLLKQCYIRKMYQFGENVSIF